MARRRHRYPHGELAVLVDGDLAAERDLAAVFAAAAGLTEGAPRTGR